MPVAGGALTPLPQFQYLVAFNNNAWDDPTQITSIAAPGVLGGTNVWTDITQYVPEHNIKRGRQHELSQFEMATLSLQNVNNNDARFNAWNTSSPYYGKLLPLRPIQVRAIYSTVTYYRFTGLVTAWGTKWDDPASGFLTIEAKDAFYVLNQANIASTTQYKSLITTNSPRAYWRLGDGLGSPTAADSSGNNRAGSVSGSGVTFGAPQALLVDPTTSAAFNGSGTIIAPSTAAISGTGAFSIECWFKTSASDTIYRPIYTQVAADGTTEIFIGIQNSQLVVGCPLSGPSAQVFSYGEIPAVNDGNWHYVLLERSAAGTTLTTQYDRSSNPQSVTAYNLVGTTVTIGGAPGNAGSPGTMANWSGNLQELAVYPSAIPTFSSQYTYGDPGTLWLSQLGSDRIGSVLTTVGWPAGARNLDTNVNQTHIAGVQSSLVTTTALSHLQSVEDTEVGAFFMDAQGRVTWIARQSLVSPPRLTTVVTLGDNPGELPWEPGPDLALDDLDILNQETVQGPVPASNTPGLTPTTGSVLQSYSDATSISQYGPRSRSLNTLNISDQDSLYHAEWDVGRLSQPIIRLRQIKINPLDDPANLFPAVLGRELLDRVTVNRHGVPGGGDAFTQTALIEAMEEKVSARDGWEVHWSLSPTDAQTVWLLGDATYGVLGTTSKLGW